MREYEQNYTSNTWQSFTGMMKEILHAKTHCGTKASGTQA